MTSNLPLSSPEQVARGLPDVGDCVVLLDFDGTLSPLVDDPAAAAPADGVARAVQALAARTRVVFVSGRAVDDLRPRLPDGLDVSYAGGHGAELAHGDGPVLAQVDDVATVVAHRDAAIAELESLVGSVPGWVIEPKPTGVAVHSRMVAQPEEYLDDVLEILARHAIKDMQVTHGHHVVELRPAGVDKGVAVGHLLDGEHRRPVAFGDDVTDEDMFAEVVARDGVAVVVATEARDTHASWRLDGPDAVVDTLTRWAQSRTQPQTSS